jgi:hypothetical protein
MKKIIIPTLIAISLIVLIVVFSLSKNSNNNSNTNPINFENITEEILRNHPESPVSDFEYSKSINYDGIKITSYNGNDKIVVIPEKIDNVPVVEIGGSVFSNNSNIKAVKLPKSAIDIGTAFMNNTNIEIVIAEGIEILDYGAFNKCSSLHTVKLGKNVNEIGLYAFGSCHELKELHIPPTLTQMTKDVQNTAFFDCHKLTIYGKKGSYIEKVAKTLEIPFVAE